jgi:uncharacterized OsmC-like protein
MEGAQTEVGSPDEASLERHVSARTGIERYRTEIAVREHGFEVDEPPRLGGGDVGPTPFDLLCAALGSCTTITLRMYADRKEWPLTEIVARVQHRRVRRSGGEAEGTTEDRFEMEVELHGSLDAAQRERLGEIAARCPVHQILARGAQIETRVVEPTG